jgi:hypothetical protein
MGQKQTKPYVVKIHDIPVSYQVDDDTSRFLPESCIVGSSQGKDVTFIDLVEAMKSFPGVDISNVQFYFQGRKNYPVRNQRDLESLYAAGFIKENEDYQLFFAGGNPVPEDRPNREDNSSSQSSSDENKNENVKTEFVKNVISQLDKALEELAEAAASFKNEITDVKLAQENLTKQISELRETMKRPEPEVKGKPKATKRQKIEPPLPMD